MMKQRNRVHGLFILLLTVFAFFGVLGSPLSESIGADAVDLTELSIEDLMNITVTSVSKKSQTISEAASAVFVITHEDIRRSGATSIPDALRMVPGVQVAKIDANKWAITARGSNGRFANKLLVLIDGRSVYTPIYSGVFWENTDTVLEDIDRIEVIRGPGASLWGANAVNGVINIITKPAERTRGLLVSGSAGTEETGNVSLRYGGLIGKETPFRVHVKGFERDASVDSLDDAMDDDWHYLRGGFRIDHQKDGRDSLTLQGDVFDGTNGETITAPTLTSPYGTTYTNDNKETGYNLLARWTRTLSSLSEISLQTYYDRNEHHLHLGKADIDTLDVEFQHRFQLGRNDITWGTGYRLYHDDFNANPDLVTMNPESKSLNIFNAFLQDEMGFFDKQLRLTLGSKFEYNDYTYFEIQPNARLLWRPNDKHSSWISVSRSVRTPSRVERDATALISVILPPAMGPLPVALEFDASDDFDSEELTAYELGYRLHATSRLTLDTSFYCNDYKNLRETSTGDLVQVGTPPTYQILPSAFTNNTQGEIYGFELAADWTASNWLSLKTAYTYMKNNIEYSANAFLISQDPRHQLSLRASLDLPRDLECDVWYRYVDDLSDSIGNYDTVDVRLGWKYGTNLELSLVGQNLFDSHHAEFLPEALHTVGTEVERGVYGKIVWSFD